MKIKLSIEGNEYNTEYLLCNKPWGIGLRFDVFEEDGAILYTFHVQNHPKFPDFDKYQNMQPYKIANLIKDRIGSGLYIDSIKKSKLDGVSIVFILNKHN